jgi:hypothetical protein
MNNKPDKMRIITLAFLTCFLIVSIISGMFILTHTDHEHDNNGIKETCVICARIQDVENILRQLNILFICTLFVKSVIYAVTGLLKAIAIYSPVSVPVTLKTRMNN